MRRVWVWLITVSLCVGLMPTPASAGDRQYFPQTGQTSSNAFYEFWQTHGALPILGMPLSPAYIDTENFIIQIYERAIMEWHPDNTRANRVQLARLGDSYLNIVEDAITHEKTGDIRRHTPPRGCATTSNCETFPTTNHTVLGAFRDYWYANGGLATFGLPLTEEYNACGTDEGTCIGHFSAQVFERNVFEWHPEVNGGSVLLRRIGALVWTDARRMNVAQNPGGLRTVPDYDGGSTSGGSSPAPVYSPPAPSQPAPVYNPPPTTTPVYIPPPPPIPVYNPPPVSQPSSGPVSGSNGVCPSGYPVKANDNSGIYHVPGQQFYDVTNARNCFATPSAAEAAGYRASKV